MCVWICEAWPPLLLPTAGLVQQTSLVGNQSEYFSYNVVIKHKHQNAASTLHDNVPWKWYTPHWSVVPTSFRVQTDSYKTFWMTSTWERGRKGRVHGREGGGRGRGGGKEGRERKGREGGRERGEGREGREGERGGWERGEGGGRREGGLVMSRQPIRFTTRFQEVTKHKHYSIRK